MVGLLYLKHAFNESDDSVCERWAENVYWQYFCGEEYFQMWLPCAPTNLVRFRQALGEAGVEELLATTIAAALQMKVAKPAEFERVAKYPHFSEKQCQWIYPSDHCENHACRGTCECARSQDAIFRKVARGTYIVVIGGTRWVPATIGRCGAPSYSPPPLQQPHATYAVPAWQPVFKQSRTVTANPAHGDDECNE
jgi:hypothetical protein